MYIPNDFQEVRPKEITSLIKNYPLACIVANTAKGLIATHVPLIMRSDNVLVGHIAIINDMKTLVSDAQEVLCIFKGEDAYISANYYPSKDRKSTRLNSSHVKTSYAVLCLKKKT